MQIDPKPAYIDALVGAMNYEGGCNPVNVTFLTGLGSKRQREIVDQYAQNDRRILPPSGIPIGNIQSGLPVHAGYGPELGAATYPGDNAATGPYPLYDRWSDAYNVTTEFITVNQARGSSSRPSWRAARRPRADRGRTPAPSSRARGDGSAQSPVTLQRRRARRNLSGSPASSGRPATRSRPLARPTRSRRRTAAAVGRGGGRMAGRPARVRRGLLHGRQRHGRLDGRRRACRRSAVSSSGGDGWNWTPPAPCRIPAPSPTSPASPPGCTSMVHRASATLSVGAGRFLFAWVYVDPAIPRARSCCPGTTGPRGSTAPIGAPTRSPTAERNRGTASRGRPAAAGRWVQLRVRARAVGLEGATLSGMSFSLIGGRATWGAAGRSR
jgi:hypothetical protein